MNKFFKVAVSFAFGVAMSTAAFASGYGPAPHYNPLQGAPASQQGPGVIMADASSETTAGGDMTAVGGSAESAFQAGHRTISSQFGSSTFKHH